MARCAASIPGVARAHARVPPSLRPSNTGLRSTSTCSFSERVAVRGCAHARLHSLLRRVAVARLIRLRVRPLRPCRAYCAVPRRAAPRRAEANVSYAWQLKGGVMLHDTITATAGARHHARRSPNGPLFFTSTPSSRASLKARKHGTPVRRSIVAFDPDMREGV